MNELPFFVYGTLRPGQVNHDRYVLGRAVREERACLPGAALYEGPGYPYAVRARASMIAGDLVTAIPAHYGGLLRALDRLEDYHGPGHPQNLYDRSALRVVGAEGGIVLAWVYLAAEPLARRLRAEGTLIPGGDWLYGRQPPRKSSVVRGAPRRLSQQEGPPEGTG
ncbi:gamma-glutamylcyclotransferase family protein [Streptomyces sp. NPDC006879]|uniref:gamma-glutamylcyclotransferase family protein n=1 Tax=Streptomyces sp. NPDC006879 TaxID=3364767 RepID=UPI00367FD97C